MLELAQVQTHAANHRFGDCGQIVLWRVLIQIVFFAFLVNFYLAATDFENPANDIVQESGKTKTSAYMVRPSKFAPLCALGLFWFYKDRKP